jgi:hypothetical protein
MKKKENEMKTVKTNDNLEQKEIRKTGACLLDY